MIPLLKGLTKGQPRQGKRNLYVAPVALVVIVALIGQFYWLSQNSHMFAPFAVSKIDCDNCQRLGVIRDEENPRILKMCSVCFGVGNKSIRKFDDQDVVCAACGGMGRIDDHNKWRTCRRCDGRGLRRVNDWKKIVEINEMDLIKLQTDMSNAQEAAEAFYHDPSTTNAQPQTEAQENP